MTGPVLVTGATGFLGRRVVRALLDSRQPVRVLVRRGLPEWNERGPEVALGDIRDPAAVISALTGCRGVIHLAAALRDEAESGEVNVGGARSLIDAGRAAGVRRLVVASTQSTRIPRKGVYARTKAEADVLFRDSGLDVTILRFSVVYGESLEGVFGALHHFVRRLPIVPVLGNGRWHSAPVYVGDVARVMLTCLDRPLTIGREYDVGGPDLFTLDALLDEIGIASGVGRRWKLHIPMGVALGAARVVTKLARHPPLTVSNVLGSNQDTPMDLQPIWRDLEIHPMALPEGLRRVFGNPLHGEAHILGEYLLGEPVRPEFLERYASAHSLLLPGDTHPALQFVRRHPFTLGILDAAGVVAVRRRLLLMAAILEASPHTTPHFLPEAAGRLASLATLASAGVVTVLKGLLGLPLRWFLRFRA